MSQFTYFVETPSHQFGQAELIEFGLDGLIDGSPLIGNCRDGASPSGKKGITVVNRGTAESASYRPQDQTWVRRRGDDRVWIGYPKDSPPRLASLARQNLLHGADVELSDGSRIHIPHARRWSDIADRLLWSVALPQSLRRNDDGQWVPDDVVIRYRSLWQLLCDYIDAADLALRTADAEPGSPVYFSFPAINELAIAGIAANYRVTADEIEICGVYDQTVRDAVIAILKDDATKERWVKKKLTDLASLSTADDGISSVGPEQSTAE
ncbi:MAG: hypothetical protein WBD31_13660 [Rubripirellula sp.]